MQKLLFLDYLDGTKDPKKYKPAGKYKDWRMHLASVAISHPELVQEDSSIDKEGLVKCALKSDTSMDLLSKAAGFIPHTFESILLMHYMHQSFSSRNFIVSTPLREALEKVSLDVSCDMVPKNFRGYFEIPGLIDDWEGRPVKCIFVQMEPRKNSDVGYPDITVGIITETEDDFHTQFHCMLGEYFSSGKTIKDALKDQRKGCGRDASLSDNGLIHSFPGAPEKHRDVVLGKGSTLNFVLNLILYVSGPSQDFIEEVNKFTGKRTKQEFLRRQYTSKPFFLLGKDVELLKVRHSEGTFRDGFFRWQPVGKGRTQVKLTWVRGHPMNFKAKKGEKI